MIRSLAVLAVMCLSSCSSDKTCNAGATQTCVCPSGKKGAQSCTSDGAAWGTCVCEGSLDAGADGNQDGKLLDGKPPASDQTAPDGTPCAKKPETCNNLDDDCNGIVDDMPAGTPNTWHGYRDSDGDGFGVTSSAAWLCKQQPGWSAKAGDCDDTRKDVNPGIAEVCGDGVDHDCDGKHGDTDVCGLVPSVVPDVNDPLAIGTTLKLCGTSGVAPHLDIIEIVAKQDGAPAITTCASYILRLGTFGKVYEMTYVYRPAAAMCTGLPQFETYMKGIKVSTKTTVAADPSIPGSVSFTVLKNEYLPSLSTPTYYLKVCTNAVADAFKDITDCTSDSCETPVHR